MKRLLFLFISLLLLVPALADAWIGDPAAVRGGTLTLHTSEFPASFNLFVNNDADVAVVFGLVYDTLLDMDPDTKEFEPLIASSWSISKDLKTFTFRIDPRARWSDGQPITALDVSFTYDLIMDPKNRTSVMRLYYSRFEKPVVIDDHTIQFRAKTVHFGNFVQLATFNVLPKHLFEGKDFNKSFNMQLPGSSGPYMLSGVRDGRFYTLTRRNDYWADILPNRMHLFNFDRVVFKIVRDDNIAFESFKKGDFDVFTYVTPRRWTTQTDSEKFQKNWIIKQKIHNHLPRGFSGLAINMRKNIFKDVRVREALSMLLDRKTIIDKLQYGMAVPLNSYWPDFGNNPPIPYDPAQAEKLLRHAGYDRLDSSGYLVNGKGERLEFSILAIMDETMEKYLTIYAQSCRNAGVKVNLDLTSGATMFKRMEQYDFDMIAMGWTSVLFEDPEQLWHSKHTNEIGGSNLPCYGNPEVDRLIEEMQRVFDEGEREKIIRRIDALIYPDVPYILFWWRNYYMVFYKNCFGMPKTVVSKYGSPIGSSNIEVEIISYWWYDPLKVKRLSEAGKKGAALPAEPEEIYFDKLYKGR